MNQPPKSVKKKKNHLICHFSFGAKILCKSLSVKSRISIVMHERGRRRTGQSDDLQKIFLSEIQTLWKPDATELSEIGTSLDFRQSLYVFWFQTVQILYIVQLLNTLQNKITTVKSQNLDVQKQENAKNPMLKPPDFRQQSCNLADLCS